MPANLTASHAELSGRLISTTATALRPGYSRLLCDYGFCAIRVDAWYGLNEWLTFLETAEAQGADVHALGRQTALSYAHCGNGCDLRNVAASLNSALNAFHRGERQGPSIVVAAQSADRVRFIARLPFPPKFVAGLIEGLMLQADATDVRVMVSCNTQHPSILGALQLYRIDVSWQAGAAVNLTGTAPA